MFQEEKNLSILTLIEKGLSNKEIISLVPGTDQAELHAVRLSLTRQAVHDNLDLGDRSGPKGRIACHKPEHKKSTRKLF